ncbi:MAG: hypothetical protein HY900_01105, partial [Deltaproteobacteria bacterium]|nr:hypothetical protein [Deltaproteobacteria bacterium]
MARFVLATLAALFLVASLARAADLEERLRVLEKETAAQRQTIEDLRRDLQAAQPPTPPQTSSLLNPNISAIGWFQAQGGRTPGDLDQHDAFELREVELGFQAVVDPYARADFFIAVNPEEGVDLEEGYLTLLALPLGFQAKLG